MCVGLVLKSVSVYNEQERRTLGKRVNRLKTKRKFLVELRVKKNFKKKLCGRGGRGREWK